MKKLLILGFLVCSRAEVIFGKKDSVKIVIDEIAGILICFLFLPFRIDLAIIGFLLFRLFEETP